jgi:16S rRNA (cytidine1402-2'-O)-methyltransferase
VGGTLYVVATPIGNLDDITLRAVEVLKSVDRVAAEDTRQTRKLLTHLGIEGKPLDALHAHSSDRDVARLVERLEKGEAVALVSDAGTPAVSDPGGDFVRRAIAAGARVVPVPGPSAVLGALTASGLATDGGFRFFGFLPRDGAARRDAIAALCDTPEPAVVFESPERAAETLAELADAMPERAACVARELTKIHEELIRGSLIELAASSERREWRGELVVVLGAWSREKHAEAIDDAAIDARIDRELAAGAHAKTAADIVAAWCGRPRREIYERVVRRRHER